MKNRGIDYEEQREEHIEQTEGRIPRLGGYMRDDRLDWGYMRDDRLID